MKTRGALGGILLLGLLCAVGTGVAGTRGQASLERGRVVYEVHCATCHGQSGAGDGPAAYLLSPRPRDLSRGIFKVRSTPSGSLPTEEDLFQTITNGMAGTAMPSWSHLPEEDRRALVELIKSFSPRWKEEGPGQTSPIPEPPPALASLASAGKAAYEKYRCGECHGPLGKGDGPSSATLRDDTSFPLRPYDFTRPGRYKGGDTPKDIYRTFSTGFDGTPMPSFGDAIPEEDRWAIVSYVRSLAQAAPATKRLPQGETLTAERVKKVPSDPDAPDWERFVEYEIPLRLLWGRDREVESVRVAAATDGEKLALRMTWADPDADTRTLRPEDFRDAAAVQFSMAGPDVTFAMGAARKPVNIWHWKADWQKDLSGREDVEQQEPAMAVDLYPFAKGLATSQHDSLFLTAEAAGNAFAQTRRVSPIEDLNAIGFGSLTPQPAAGQNVAGRGTWSRGEWKVVFLRSLTSKEEGDAPLTSRVPVAFAVWNGSDGDRNGIKSVSGWYWLAVKKSAAAGADSRSPRAWGSRP